MATQTSSEIQRYYRSYREEQVVFNAGVIRFLGLLPSSIYLKSGRVVRPCLVYSATMSGARVLVDLTPEFRDAVRAENNSVALHLSFEIHKRTSPLTFFLNGRMTGTSRYRGRPGGNFHLLVLEYSRKPPDGFIGMLGEIVESSINRKRWKDVRITLLPRAMKEIDVDSSDTIVEINGRPTKCIIRDLSFNGAKVIVAKQSKPLKDGSVTLYIPFGDQQELIKIKGAVTRFEYGTHEDLVAVSIVYDPATIPLAYITNINQYLIANNVSIEK